MGSSTNGHKVQPAANTDQPTTGRGVTSATHRIRRQGLGIRRHRATLLCRHALCSHPSRLPFRLPGSRRNHAATRRTRREQLKENLCYRSASSIHTKTHRDTDIHTQTPPSCLASSGHGSRRRANDGVFSSPISPHTWWKMRLLVRCDDPSANHHSFLPRLGCAGFLWAGENPPATCYAICYRWLWSCLAAQVCAVVCCVLSPSLCRVCVPEGKGRLRGGRMAT